MKPLRQRKALVLCDFDGTTCVHDVGSALLNHYAADGWKEIDREYLQGKTGSRSAYSRIAPFLYGDMESIQSFAISRSRIARGFRRFYRLCRLRDIDVKILSDGFDVYIGAILKHRRLADIDFYANALAVDADGKMTISFPGENLLCGRCGNCKSHILNAYRLRYERIIYVGDGQSDVCPSRQADVIFARDALLKTCLEEGRPCFPFEDFTVIGKYIKEHY